MQAVSGLFRTMRPHQWTKNILIFAAIVFDAKLTEIESLSRVIAAVILFILMSGTVYIINDLVDIENDRRHPKKKYRPIPSGQLPIPLARLAVLVIPVATVIAALTFSKSLTLVLVLYLLLQIVYSFWMKNIVLLDVLAVTAGFVLRVLAGVVVINVNNFSPWLYVCSGLLALFLIIGKRRQELVKLGDKASETRPIFKHYNLPLLDDMLRMVTTGTLITYILYTIEVPTRKIADINITLVTVPFVLYSLFRYLYLIHVKGEGGAPDEVLLTDRPLQIAIVLWGLTFLLIIYLP